MHDLNIIKAKVRKLLALSKSDNENEATAALKKANDLIEAHGLDEAALRFESMNVRSTKTSVPWRNVTANAVSWLYGCHNYIDGEFSVRVFTGESLDVFMATEMYSYLIKSIERCAKKTIRKNAKFKFRRDFKYGMACSLYDRIKELGEACSWSSRRNTKIEEARKYVTRSIALYDCSKETKNFNRVALHRGMRHGDNVSLARQAGYEPALQIAGSSRATAQGELF